MGQIDPTLADQLSSWQQQMADAIIVISTLPAEDALAAARELAREYAQPDQTVVLTAIGAGSPFFWHIPAGKPLETARPDALLLLVHNKFSPSTRLLFEAAHQIVLITGTTESDLAEALKLLEIIRRQSIASRIEIIIVTDSQQAAKDTGARLTGASSGRLGRTDWRRLPPKNIRQDKEEPEMSTRVRPMSFSEAESRAKDWEENFRRAEKLLIEAQQALRVQMQKGAIPPPVRPVEQPSSRAAV